MKCHDASVGLLSSFSATLASLLYAQEPASAPPEQPVMFMPQPPGKGVQWRFGDTTVKLGGFVKVDLIHDFDAIGSTDTFDPRTIPTDGSDGTNTRMHARQSRLNLDVRGPNSGSELRAFIEGDFFGSGSSFRLRHAYGAMGPVLAGQAPERPRDYTRVHVIECKLASLRGRPERPESSSAGHDQRHGADQVAPYG